MMAMAIAACKKARASTSESAAREEIDRHGLGHSLVGGRAQHPLPKAGLAMLVAIPLVHRLQTVNLMGDGELRPFGQYIQRFIGDNGCDFEN
jgi:hypothetical protein